MTYSLFMANANKIWAPERPWRAGDHIPGSTVEERRRESNRQLDVAIAAKDKAAKKGFIPFEIERAFRLANYAYLSWHG